MADGISTHEGWYVRGNDGAADWQRGPYLWTELVAFSLDGRLQPHNLVWHAARPEWHPASSVPGLFPQTAQVPPREQPPVVAAPATTPAAAPSAPSAVVAPSLPAPAPETGVPGRRKFGKITAAILIGLLLLAAVGAGAWALFFRDGGQAASGPAMGVAETGLPDRATLIATEEWGEVPASQVIVVLTEDAERSDAERVTASLGGSIVGELEFVNLYQIEFPGISEEDLRAAIAAAEADEAVDYAYPNAQVQSDEEIWGVRTDPYTDPVYSGDAGAGYAAIGVSSAWAYIRGTGADLSPVHVGIVDDGLYRPGTGAESEFDGAVNVNFPDADAGELSQPAAKNTTNGIVVNQAGSHGTGVATIIGASAENGGTTGIAAPLGSNLTISMTNHFSGKYGDFESTADPEDPTKQVWYNGKTYSLGSLVAITKQIEDGASIVLFSEGLRWLAKETGKSEAQLRPAIGKMLKAAGGDANAGLVLGVLRDAKRERKADPVAWVMGVLSGRSNARAGPPVERDYGKGALAELIRNVDERLRNEPDGRAEGEISRGNVLSLPVVQGVQTRGRDDDDDVSPFAQWLRPGSG